MRWRRWTYLDWKTSARTTRWLPLHLQRSTVTHINTHCAVLFHSQEHPHTPRSRNIGTPRCDRAPLTSSFGTVGQWERQHRAMVGSRNTLTLHATPPRTVLHRPFSIYHNCHGRRHSKLLECVDSMGLCRISSCSSFRLWKTPSRRTQQIRRCGVAVRVHSLVPPRDLLV